MEKVFAVMNNYSYVSMTWCTYESLTSIFFLPQKKFNFLSHGTTDLFLFNIGIIRNTHFLVTASEKLENLFIDIRGFEYWWTFEKLYFSKTRPLNTEPSALNKFILVTTDKNCEFWNSPAIYELTEGVSIRLRVDCV